MVGALTRLRAFCSELIDELQRVRDVSRLGPRRRDRVGMWWVWLRLILNQRLHLRRTLELDVRFRGSRGSIRATIADVSELRVLREVFSNREYELPEVNPSVILDLGSNVGLSVLFFRDLYPDADIIAVEPHPRTFERLRRNVEHVAGVILVQAAIKDGDGPVTLYAGDESWAASVHSTGQIAIEVPGLTIDSVLRKAGAQRADVVKMDIEGAEIPVLSAPGILRAADLIVFEFHSEYADTGWAETISCLTDFELIDVKGASGAHPLVTLRRREQTRPEPSLPPPSTAAQGMARTTM